ncbi:hypothetical protein [Vibrio celticus]|uniref:hypothetical protein n=1 Tax=Vibrio celticus TaxID=446372 RepID=UPI0011119BDB|nr:hypothetical protein [Vibrio celticus]
MDKRLLFVLLPFLLCLILFLLPLLINQTSDVVLIRSVLEVVITLVLFYLSIKIFDRRISRLSLDSVLKFVFNIVFLQSLIIIYMIFSPGFFDMIHFFIDAEGKGFDVIDSGYRFRQVGLTGWTGYSMAVVQSFGLFLVPLLLRDRKSVIKYSVFSLVIISSILLSARTGLIFIFAYFLFVSLYCVSFKNRNMIRLVRLHIMILLSMFSIFILWFIQTEQAIVVGLREWVFEIFNSYIETGSFDTGSTSVMKEMFFFPDMYTILLGDGLYLNMNGGYYMSTDIGYLRVILYSGIIGSLIYYFSFLIFFTMFSIEVDKIQRNRLSYIFVFFTFCVLIVQVKGSILVDGVVLIRFFSIILVSSLLLNNRSRT